MIISVYTDGSCDNSEGTGGYGYVITATHKGKNVIKKHISEKYVSTTSNRMELKAIIKALANIDPGHTIDIYSDSEYCVNSINGWLEKWVSTGKLKNKSNSDLWLKFIDTRKKHEKSKLKFTWVRSHNGTILNEMADKLANSARLKQGTGYHCRDNN